MSELWEAAYLKILQCGAENAGDSVGWRTCVAVVVAEVEELQAEAAIDYEICLEECPGH